MAAVPFKVNITQGPEAGGELQDFETAFARRALMLMRRLLGDKGITDLLRGEIDASEKYWQQMSDDSKGKWTPARVALSSRGITSKDFMTWFIPRDGIISPEKVAAHPEHWSVYVDKEAHGLSTLETLGDRVTHFNLVDDGTASDFVEEMSTHPTKQTGKGYTESGVHMLEVYHQFKDHEDGKGFDVDLAVYFPAACEKDLIETHRRHLLVEFSNWFQDAYTGLKSKN